MKHLLLLVSLLTISTCVNAQSSFLLSFDKDLGEDYGLGIRYNEQAWEEWGVHLNANILFNGRIPKNVVSRVYLQNVIAPGDTSFAYLGRDGSYTFGFQAGPTYRISGSHHLQASMGLQFQTQHDFYTSEQGTFAEDLGMNVYGSTSVGYAFLDEVFTIGLFYTESWTSDSDYLSLAIGFTIP